MNFLRSLCDTSPRSTHIKTAEWQISSNSCFCLGGRRYAAAVQPSAKCKRHQRVTPFPARALGFNEKHQHWACSATPTLTCFTDSPIILTPPVNIQIGPENRQGLSIMHIPHSRYTKKWSSQCSFPKLKLSLKALETYTVQILVLKRKRTWVNRKMIA